MARQEGAVNKGKPGQLLFSVTGADLRLGQVRYDPRRQRIDASVAARLEKGRHLVWGAPWVSTGRKPAVKGPKGTGSLEVTGFTPPCSIQLPVDVVHTEKHTKLVHLPKPKGGTRVSTVVVSKDVVHDHAMIQLHCAL